MADIVNGSIALTDAQIAQSRIDNNVPANFITVRTVNGGAVFVDPNAANASQLIAQYQSGQLGYSSYTNDPGAITTSDAVPGGVYLRLLPNPAPITPQSTPVASQPAPSTPAPSTPSQPAPPPTVSSTPISAPTTSIQYLTISGNIIDRDYVKGTMRPIATQTLQFVNTSTNVTLTVGIRTAGGVVFTPSSFSIQAGQSQDVEVSFDVVQIDTLPEGLSSVNVMVDVTSDLVELPPPNTTPTTVTTGPIQTWLEWTGLRSTPIFHTGTPPAGWVQRPYYQVGDTNTPTGLAWAMDSTSQGSTQDTTVAVSSPVTWISGLDGSVLKGLPTGWVADPFDNRVYPPTSPYVLSGFDRTMSTNLGSNGAFYLNGVTGLVTVGPPPDNWALNVSNDMWYPATQNDITTSQWTNGVDGASYPGRPPLTWSQDQTTGAWYPPFALRVASDSATTISQQIANLQLQYNAMKLVNPTVAAGLLSAIQAAQSQLALVNGISTSQQAPSTGDATTIAETQAAIAKITSQIATFTQMYNAVLPVDATTAANIKAGITQLQAQLNTLLGL